MDMYSFFVFVSSLKDEVIKNKLCYYFKRETISFSFALLIANHVMHTTELNAYNNISLLFFIIRLRTIAFIWCNFFRILTSIDSTGFAFAKVG